MMMMPVGSMLNMAVMRRRPAALALASRLMSTVKAKATINLTPYASPVLLRLHPDRMQRHASRQPDAMADNEAALKQLNQFLEIAAFGCNNDGYRARKQILSLAADAHDEADAPIRWRLRLHIQADDDSDEWTPVEHVVDVPAPLVRRTLAHGTRAAARNASDAVATPFAREWQRTAKRELERLFQAAQIPLYTEAKDQDAERKPTQLALWLQEDDSEEAQYERGVAAHNAAVHRMHRDFDQLFQGMLAKEKNIVHSTTTGLEDGPTTQHAILTKLVAQRLFLERIPDREEKRRVFFWLANILLVNFMELKLHSLVWNKVVLMVTKDESLETPQVLWDSEKPAEGMALLIPAGMDSYTLVDTMFEHIQELELALDETAKRQVSRARSQQRQKQAADPNAQPARRKKKHFYSDEVAAMFRNR